MHAVAIRAPALAVALLLGPVCLHGQGLVRGSVRGPQGEAIPGASVVVPGTTLSTRTDLSGRFRIPSVPAGAVRLLVGAIGFARVDTTVSLTGGDSTTVDITLAFAPLSLPPVDIVSNKVPHFGDRPPTSVAQVTEQEIQRRAVGTIDEAIEHVPAIQFVNGQINIRGSTGYVQGLNSRVLMTVDGNHMIAYTHPDVVAAQIRQAATSAVR